MTILDPVQATVVPCPATEHPTPYQILSELFEPAWVSNAHLCERPPGTDLWNGYRVHERFPDPTQIKLADDKDVYLSVGMPSRESRQRGNGWVVRDYLVVLDDVGVKAPRANVEGLEAFGFVPVMVVETSPGSFQYYFRLPEPVLRLDPDQADRLALLELIRARLGDSNAAVKYGDTAVQDPARYMRLPFGINSKPKYLRGDGTFPTVRLEAWNPGARVSLEQWAAFLLGPDWQEQVAQHTPGTKPASANAGPGGDRTASMDDVYVRLAARVGLDPHYLRPGVVGAICPNAAAHTNGDPSGFAFINPYRGHCFHEHCSHLSPADFMGMIEAMYEDQVQDDIAAGTLTRDADGAIRDKVGELVPATGRAWMAHDEFVNRSPLPQAEVEALEALPPAKPHKEPTNNLDRMLRLVDRLVASGWECVKSTDGRYFVRFGAKTFNLDSGADMDDLSGILLRDFNQPMAGDSKKTLRDLLVQRASAGARQKVYCRSANSTDGVLYLDLADEQDRVVEITATGWRVQNRGQVGVIFERRNGMLPLPMPVRALGTPSFPVLLLKHLNVPAVVNPADKNDPGVQALAGLVSVITACFRRKGTLPLLLLAGAMGSGKTRFATRLKMLIDPDESPSTPSLGNDEKEILLTARSQSLLVLDNASSIKPMHSDVYCAILDGVGYSARALYTNADRFVMTAHTGMALTSIRDELISREDLLDRTIRVELEPLKVRRSVEELDAEWNADLPNLLAALLDMMVAGLAGLEAVKAATNYAGLPRLVDMALFAEAALRSEGWPPRLCIDALVAAREAAVRDNVTQNPVATAIAAVVKDKDFDGTMDELRLLCRVVDGCMGKPVFEALPRFSGAVTRLVPQLALLGIKHFKNPRTSGGRTFQLIKPRGVTVE